LKKQLEERKVALEYEVQNKTLFLEQTRQSETRYQSLLSKAKEQQDSASSEITDLEKKVRERLAQKAKEKEGKEGSEGIKFSDKGFIWPVPQSYITSKFHDPDYPFRRSLGEHSAADIKASQGTPLKAAASGYIARVKFDGSRNYAYIMIIHGDGLSTVYGHVSGVNIKADEYVVQGQVIGQTGGLPGTPGAGPFSTGAHLHFEVRKDGIPVDPEEYLPK
ncbi:MAG: M23 family metallopeptidase, partial [Planctomycetes bacterium]|nr:M23 family metallopeptidase [Planctomycetota bacterium]